MKINKEDIFESYDVFQELNRRNHLKLDKSAAIQIRKTWIEKETAGEQWWARYVIYKIGLEGDGTVKDLLYEVKDEEIYITNPGALIKTFKEAKKDEDELEELDCSFKRLVGGFERTVDTPVLKMETPTQIIDKVKSVGGEVLDNDGDHRFKIRINNEVNWYTYNYIMNRL